MKKGLNLKIFLNEEKKKSLKEGAEFDAAFAKHQDQADKKDNLETPFTGDEQDKQTGDFSLDDPFKEECGCSDPMHDHGVGIPTGTVEPHNIEVSPGPEPLDSLERVVITISDEPTGTEEVPMVSDVPEAEPEVSTFHAPESPELNEYEALQEKIYAALEEMMEPGDDEKEDSNLDALLKDLEDEEFGKMDYSGSEDKPRGF